MRKLEIIALLVVTVFILLLSLFMTYQKLSQGNKTDIVNAKPTIDMAYFQQATPSTAITAITDINLSLNNLYRLTTANDKHLLITKDRRYLVIGAVMDLKTGKLIGNNAQAVKGEA